MGKKVAIRKSHPTAVNNIPKFMQKPHCNSHLYQPIYTKTYTMRIKNKKHSQNLLTNKLVRTNIYTNKTTKMFAYSREDAECLSKEKIW